jgi:hypothetical protein
MIVKYLCHLSSFSVFARIFSPSEAIPVLSIRERRLLRFARKDGDSRVMLERIQASGWAALLFRILGEFILPSLPLHIIA